MKYNTKIFDVELIEINNKKHIHFINIKDVGVDLQTLIEKHIVSICDSDVNTPISIVKKDLIKFFLKKDITTKFSDFKDSIACLWTRRLVSKIYELG